MEEELVEKEIDSRDKLVVGVRVPCLWKDNKFHLAKVIDIRDKDGEQEFYIHYTDFNKRLDEWVSKDNLDLTRINDEPEISKKKKI